MKSHQHFIPRLHLRRFANNGMLMVYLHREDLLILRKQSIADTAVDRHAYSVQVAGRRTDALENALADGIERAITPVLDKLDSASSGPLSLTVEERVRLSRYLGSLYTRVPGMAKPFINVMNETVSQPGWKGLDNAYIGRLVQLCQLTNNPDEKPAWDEVLGYLGPGAAAPTVEDPSRLHRIAVGTLIVGSLVFSSDWTVFRMPAASRLVLPDRPMAIMGRPSQADVDSRDVFFAVPLSPASLLVGGRESPLAEQVVSGAFSHPFLARKWTSAFDESNGDLADPAVFHAHLAFAFADKEVYAGFADDLHRVRALAGRRAPAKVAAVRP